MKRKCAEAAFKMIREGMVVGLGGGETIQYLIEFIHMSGIKIKIVTPSAKTALIAAQHELEIIPTWLCDHVDIAFDGCNEIDRQLLCLKSMGAIHTQEKIIGSMADEYVILAPETRFFEHLSFDVPLTIEIMKDAYSCIMKKLFDLGFTAAPRSSKEKDGFVMSDNGNIIVDIDMRSVEDPVQANETISALYGVVDTSLFANVVTKALIASKEGNCHHSINSKTPEHENRGLFFECADSFILKPAEDHEHVFLSSRNTLGIQTVKKTVVSDLMNP